MEGYAMSGFKAEYPKKKDKNNKRPNRSKKKVFITIHAT